MGLKTKRDMAGRCWGSALRLRTPRYKARKAGLWPLAIVNHATYLILGYAKELDRTNVTARDELLRLLLTEECGPRGRSGPASLLGHLGARVTLCTVSQLKYELSSVITAHCCAAPSRCLDCDDHEQDRQKGEALGGTPTSAVAKKSWEKHRCCSPHCSTLDIPVECRKIQHVEEL